MVKCEKCLEEFVHQWQLNRHNNKKIPCDKECKFKCNECENKYAHMSTLSRHKKIHKLVNNNADIKIDIAGDNNGDIKVENEGDNNADTKIDITGDHNAPTVNNDHSINNSDNSIDNSTTNVTNNINIHLPESFLKAVNNFGEENCSIFNNPYVILYLLDCEKVFTEITKMLHCNEAYKENMNICTTKNREILNIVNENKWTKRKFKQLKYPLSNKMLKVFRRSIDHAKKVLPSKMFDKVNIWIKGLDNPTDFKLNEKFEELIADQIQDALYDYHAENPHLKEKETMFTKNVKESEKIDADITNKCKKQVEKKYGENEHIKKFIKKSKKAETIEDDLNEEIKKLREKMLTKWSRKDLNITKDDIAFPSSDALDALKLLFPKNADENFDSDSDGPIDIGSECDDIPDSDSELDCEFVGESEKEESKKKEYKPVKIDHYKCKSDSESDSESESESEHESSKKNKSNIRKVRIISDSETDSEAEKSSKGGDTDFDEDDE
jgi:hypothetical protein